MNIDATTIVKLLKDEQFALEKINAYCNWCNKPSPFSVTVAENIYARTKDVLALVHKEDIVNVQRVNNRKLFIDLGSLRLTDIGFRAEVVTDYRLLVTWLHNSCSVAAFLLTNQPTFNAYMGGLAPKYSMSYLSEVYYSESSSNNKVVKLESRRTKVKKTSKRK